MNISKERVASKDLGISSTVTIKPNYWTLKAEQQKRWKEQDQDNAKK